MKNLTPKKFTFTHICLGCVISLILISYSVYYGITLYFMLTDSNIFKLTFSDQQILKTYLTLTTVGHTVVAVSFLAIGDLILPQLLNDRMKFPKLIHISFIFLILSFLILAVGVILAINLSSSEWTIYYPSESGWLLEKKILALKAVDFALASIYCFLSSLFCGSFSFFWTITKYLLFAKRG